MTTRLVMALCFLLVSCKSDKQKAFERLAATANPLFTAIRATAIKLFAIKGDDPAATAEIIETCKSADEPLWQLRNVNFNDDALYPDDQPPWVSTYAGEMLDRRKFFCRSDDGDMLRIQRCRKWCLETWEHLVSSVGDLQAAASREGVAIVALSPITKKQAYEQIAPEVNPILTALRPTAALMLRDLPAMENTPASTAKIIATCGSDQALRRLRDVKFDIQERRISESAQHLLKLSEFACLTSSDTDIPPDQCRERCLSVWQYLKKDVDSLRTAASKEGVEIVELFP